jgi:hypothetical protein
MPADAAKGIIEYLKANPEAAKAAWGQAQSMLKTPGLANAFLNMVGVAWQHSMPALLCCFSSFALHHL